MKIVKKEIDLNFVKKWMNLGINPIILSILSRRNLNTQKDIFNSFLPLFENLPSPFHFKQIITSFKRIDKAIENKEKIIIFGDRDVDGTTSTYIIYDFLKGINADVEWYLPVNEEPYGLSNQIIEKWNNKKYKLCITVDCGITNFNEIKLLKEMEIDTIIIDHHEPPEILPESTAIINPLIEQFLEVNTAACGVVFLFVFGYIFYKSKYFNKEIAIIREKNNKVFLDLYNNLILQKTIDMSDQDIEHLYDFFISDIKLKEFPELKEIKEKIKILDYDLKIKNAELFCDDIMLNKIILFYNIFMDFEELQLIKEKYLPMVMLGTMADLMPLRDINRIYTYLGLKYIKQTKSENILNLLNQLKIDKDLLNSKDIYWLICPLLNAPGRMGNANLTVNFFLDYNKNEIINDLISINEKRKKEGNEAYYNYLNHYNNNSEEYLDELAFFYSDEIEAGITGITATKISKSINCPTIVATRQGNEYTGSIRGESSYHFVDFLSIASNILIQFGGHQCAAGFRFYEKDLNKFKDFLKNNSFLLTQENKEEIIIDAEIPVKFLNNELYKTLAILEPFGADNNNPVLLTQDIEIDNYLRIGKNKEHLKIFFKTNNGTFIGLFWNKGEWFENFYTINDKYNVIYQLETNNYNNQLTIQMNIIEIIKKGI